MKTFYSRNYNTSPLLDSLTEEPFIFHLIIFVFSFIDFFFGDTNQLVSVRDHRHLKDTYDPPLTPSAYSISDWPFLCPFNHFQNCPLETDDGPCLKLTAWRSSREKSVKVLACWHFVSLNPAVKTNGSLYWTAPPRHTLRFPILTPHFHSQLSISLNPSSSHKPKKIRPLIILPSPSSPSLHPWHLFSLPWFLPDILTPLMCSLPPFPVPHTETRFL